jgi:hypothetical protein
VEGYDEALGLCPLFFRVPRREAVYVRGVLDSYECLGVVRSEETGLEYERPLMVLLAPADFRSDALDVLGRLAVEVGLSLESPTPGQLELLRRRILGR